MATPPNPTHSLSRPTFPAHQSSLNPSQTTSSFQSYNSGMSTSAASSPASSAPLPSPSLARNPPAYFSSTDLQQQHQQQVRPRPSASAFDYTPNRQGAGSTAAETSNFLGQAGLLAEAAKRAQMAVVMRDLDGMEL